MLGLMTVARHPKSCAHAPRITTVPRVILRWGWAAHRPTSRGRPNASTGSSPLSDATRRTRSGQASKRGGAAKSRRP
eukprot:1767817-Prymnesium_polylepis.1